MKLLIEGKPISRPLSSIRFYLISKSLKFAHLPDPGGLLDQSPVLLDEWTYISQEENEAEAKRQKEEERRQKHESKSSSKQMPRPRRR